MMRLQANSMVPSENSVASQQRVKQASSEPSVSKPGDVQSKPRRALSNITNQGNSGSGSGGKELAAKPAPFKIAVVPSEGPSIEKPRSKTQSSGAAPAPVSSRTRTKALMTKSIDSFQMDRIERAFPADPNQPFDGGIDLNAISLAAQLSRYPLPMPSSLEAKPRRTSDRAHVPEQLLSMGDDLTFPSASHQFAQFDQFNVANLDLNLDLDMDIGAEIESIQFDDIKFE